MSAAWVGVDKYSPKILEFCVAKNRANSEFKAVAASAKCTTHYNII